MARVNVYARGDDAYLLSGQGKSTLIGWFDDRSCTEYVREDTRWNGNNHVGVLSGLQIGYEALMRTKKGQWVRHYDSRNEFSGPEYYEFLTDEEAKTWLIRNGDYEDAVQVLERYFGELEEETGPNLGGRPAVGPKVELRLPKDVIGKVNEAAAAADLSRPEWLRQAVEEKLARMA